MLVKIVILPIYLLLLAVRVVFGILIRMADWIFYLLGGLFLLITILCYYFGLESGDSLRSMVISSGIMFLIPQAAVLVEGILEICTLKLGNIIGGR